MGWQPVSIRSSSMIVFLAKKLVAQLSRNLTDLWWLVDTAFILPRAISLLVSQP